MENWKGGASWWGHRRRALGSLGLDSRSLPSSAFPAALSQVMPSLTSRALFSSILQARDFWPSPSPGSSYAALPGAYGSSVETQQYTRNDLKDKGDMVNHTHLKSSEKKIQRPELPGHLPRAGDQELEYSPSSTWRPGVPVLTRTFSK